MRNASLAGNGFFLRGVFRMIRNQAGAGYDAVDNPREASRGQDNLPSGVRGQ